MSVPNPSKLRLSNAISPDRMSQMPNNVIPRFRVTLTEFIVGSCEEGTPPLEKPLVGYGEALR